MKIGLTATADLKEINEHLTREYNVKLIDFFNYLRLNAIKEELSGNPNLGTYVGRVLRKPLEEIINTPSLTKEQIDGIESFCSAQGIDWKDNKFHLHNRITTIDELVSVFPETEKEDIEHVLTNRYDLSILPLNIAINNRELLHKFFPKKDFFVEHSAKQTDPYGIFGKGARVEVDSVYVGSQKFPRSLLMNITDACPIGCVGCYKGEYTRTEGKDFYTNLAKATSIQTEKLVKYLNENKNIESVIMSGGEPLLLSNDGIKKVLDKLREAEYLSEFRICTGAIFQGLPYRIDSRLLQYLKEFEDSTGIQVHFNAHLSHPSQFTPEALIAIKKIKEKGFSINTQVPLQRGVNVFIDGDKEKSKEKTLSTLYELAELQGKSGIRPYKYILHMNCGSLEYSVPLEFMLDVVGELKYRPDHPWPETWQPVSVSILCKEGNILLSPQLVFGMEKTINEKEGYVEYKIPLPQNGFKPSIYREPIIKGYNDDLGSLNHLREQYRAVLRK